jgi:hypothetical protein
MAPAPNTSIRIAHSYPEAAGFMIAQQCGKIRILSVSAPAQTPSATAKKPEGAPFLPSFGRSGLVDLVSLFLFLPLFLILPHRL